MQVFKHLILLLTAILVISCSSKKNDDVWIVATSADNPPYEFMDKGKIQGFDIDLMNEIGRRLDKKIKFKNSDFHGLLASLATGNVDLVIAGMSVTTERMQKVDFSIPYIETSIAFLVKKDQNINQVQDLKGKKVGSQLGTIWSNIAYDLGAEHQFKNKTLANNLMLVEELKLGRLDAVVMEQFQVNKFQTKNIIFESFGIENSSEFSIAMPKGSKLKSQIDEAIKQMQHDGFIRFLQEKWGLR